MKSLLIVAAILALWNIITFIMYGLDKSKAKKKQWRISETTLLMVAFFMGGIGAFLGMTFLRHKTQHMKFKVLVPLAIAFNIGVMVLGWVLLW